LQASLGKLGKLPALPGAILRGPKNRFLRCPARKKVLERPLHCPKTAHKHYGTLPWGPWSTTGPSKLNFVNFTLFYLKPSQNAPPNAPAGARGVFFATPKPVSGGPCGQPSAWMPPTVSQDTTQSLWDPTVGSPGHPGCGKIKKIAKFARFRGKFGQENCRTVHGTVLRGPPKLV